MLSLPEFAMMIEHNNELLANEQKRNENMKDTLEKSKKSCKYTEKFKLKCDEIYKHFYISKPNYWSELNKDDLKEKDEIIKNYEDYNSKYEELGIVNPQNMIVNRYTNLPDFALVINCLEGELNEIKNENNKLQVDIVKNNDQYDLSIAFNELYVRICDYLSDKLYLGIIICDDCLKSYEPDSECENVSNNDSDYGALQVYETIAYYDGYRSNCNTQPLCSNCWYNKIIK